MDVSDLLSQFMCKRDRRGLNIKLLQHAIQSLLKFAQEQFSSLMVHAGNSEALFITHCLL
jgi:hypothetical protein